MKQTGRDMVLWQGTCIVHETFSEKKIIELLMRNPGAELIAHPECEEPVLRHAKFIGSTTALLKYAVLVAGQTLIVATEEGILHQMKRDAPRQDVHPGAARGRELRLQPVPAHAAQHDGEALSLPARSRRRRIEMDEALRLAAKKPIDKMLEMSTGILIRPRACA